MADCTCSNHQDSSGFTAGVLLGMILGASGMHFLSNTEEGREAFAKIKKTVIESIKELGENETLSDKIADLQKIMNATRTTINHTAGKIVEATQPGESKKAEPKKNFFQKMGASLGK